MTYSLDNNILVLCACSVGDTAMTKQRGQDRGWEFDCLVTGSLHIQIKVWGTTYRHRVVSAGVREYASSWWRFAKARERMPGCEIIACNVSPGHLHPMPMVRVGGPCGGAG